MCFDDRLDPVKVVVAQTEKSRYGGGQEVVRGHHDAGDLACRHRAGHVEDEAMVCEPFSDGHLVERCLSVYSVYRRLELFRGAVKRPGEDAVELKETLFPRVSGQLWKIKRCCECISFFVSYFRLYWLQWLQLTPNLRRTG